MKKQLIAAAAAVTGLTLAVAPTVDAAEPTLADLLLADGDEFDTNQDDFDIVTEAVLATGLGGAAGSLELTAFLPTDKAFRILVEDLYGVSIKDEAELFDAIVGALTVDGVRNVLLYHLVAGTVLAADVVALGDGAPVPTLLGPALEIDVKGKGQIRLIDGTSSLRDPIIRATDIVASNGVAHVIDRVLVPGA